MMLSIDSADYENIRSQLHKTRMENAENRAKLTQMNREKIELQHEV